jgi:sulfatase modifying factor 1
MDRFEVSVSNYAQCVQAGVCTAPTCSYQGNDPVKVRCNWQRPDSQDHPINGLTHAQAQAYCAHKKMRLPTDDEWEIAARGPKGRPFPWGNAMIGPSQQSLANIADRNAKFRWGWPSIHGVDDGWAGTAPVGSYPKGQSPFGVMDLIGNVWEWTATAQGPDKIRIRGAGYANHGFYLQASSWDEKPLTTAEPYLGFRCVRSMVQAAP